MMSFYNYTDEELEKNIGYATETLKKFQIKKEVIQHELDKLILDTEFEEQLLNCLKKEKTRREHQ